jgi:hypothetical protein
LPIAVTVKKRPQDMTRVAEIISVNSSKMIKTNKQKTNNERKKLTYRSPFS